MITKKEILEYFLFLKKFKWKTQKNVLVSIQDLTIKQINEALVEISILKGKAEIQNWLNETDQECFQLILEKYENIFNIVKYVFLKYPDIKNIYDITIKAKNNEKVHCPICKGTFEKRYGKVFCCEKCKNEFHNKLNFIKNNKVKLTKELQKIPKPNTKLFKTISI
jgi:ribosomal protein L37AE/L43A